MKTKHFFIYVTLIFAFVAFNNSQIFAQKLTISNLKDSGYEGCGCAFQTLAEAKKPRSEKIVFWSEDRDTGILNVDGKDTEFKLVKEGVVSQNLC